MLLGKKYIGTVAYMGGIMALPEQFCWSFAQMVQYNADYLVEGNQGIFYDRATASYHSYARNVLANRMRGEWLLMLDTDHTFEPDLCARMISQMDRYGIDVLSGIYQFKSHPHPPVLYMNGKNDSDFELLGDWVAPAKGEFLLPVTSAGAGCLMVRKSVFQKIQKELKESPFDIIHPFSEDHSFFKRLAKLGIKAYCNPAIECNHLMVKPLTMADYDKSGLKFSEMHSPKGE